jgi:hypothetical protein
MPLVIKVHPSTQTAFHKAVLKRKGLGFALNGFMKSSLR